MEYQNWSISKLLIPHPLYRRVSFLVFDHELNVTTHFGKEGVSWSQNSTVIIFACNISHRNYYKYNMPCSELLHFACVSYPFFVLVISSKTDENWLISLFLLVYDISSFGIHS